MFMLRVVDPVGLFDNLCIGIDVGLIALNCDIGLWSVLEPRGRDLYLLK